MNDGALGSGSTLSGYFAGLRTKNALPGKWDDCALKADRTPTGPASVTSSRLAFIDDSAGAIRSSGRARANSEAPFPFP